MLAVRTFSPLPSIEQLIDANSKFKILSFMDTFSGYHQIFMDLEDKEKIAFTIGKDRYYYQMTPFRLKNAKAIYQRLMNIIFLDPLGQNVRVYIDDVIIKSRVINHHFNDLH